MKTPEIPGLVLYPSSEAQTAEATYFVARRKNTNEKVLAVIGCAGAKILTGAEDLGQVGGKCAYAAPMNHANAVAIRKVLPWTAPKTAGLATSVGLGDRLGLATPGHIRAVRGSGLVPFLSQQSIREMTRTRRTADEVMDAATWGVLQEGWREGFGSDADHLQKPEDINVTSAAGFTMFTIDPGAHVNNLADTLDAAGLKAAFESLDSQTLGMSGADMMSLYTARPFKLEGGGEIAFDQATLARAAVKYGRAVAHTVMMHQHLSTTHAGAFELEISVDETDSPTSPAEHYFFAAELARRGVKWVSLAPRFLGRFEKGVDYIGDLNEFRSAFVLHAAVMRTLGPYKISIHSGSDKFSVYPIIAELTGGLVHLKTAGTSYLEALRAIASIDPALFREILDFARGRYDTDKASYHVSAQVAKVPAASSLKDSDLAGLLEDFDARQVLHCTFGSVLTADDGTKFRPRFYAALQRDEEVYYNVLEKHMKRHVSPFITK